MFDPNTLTGADISTEFCGIKLRSPYILSSGPLGYGAKGLIRAHQAGCGAVVTKTIRIGRAINPVRHIAAFGNTSLVNCEKWSDLEREQWYEQEIPQTKAAGAVVIASVGHTPEEARVIVKDAQKAGADMIELVSYTEESLLPMLETAKNLADIPVICKLSANWPDAAATGLRCLERGADGICAIDSIGPVLKIDVEHARPALAGAEGRGWMSGEALRPLSLHVNAAIAKAAPDFHNLYGSGGCMSAHDAVEYFMAGCSCVGVCSIGILRGIDSVERMCRDLSALLQKLGYPSVTAARGVALPYIPDRDVVSKLKFSFEPFANEHTGARGCSNCRRCVTVCAYGARSLDYPDMHVDPSLCRDCGACADVCPTGALFAEILPQSADDLEREAELAALDEKIKLL
ncbi:NAD-dependent dihydropyrimidine dehydrogenase subunit PreA [bioreactor metagenome]|uniref:Dihydrothymine dehydrogenase n=1 Tax=bioreactor metagenome TaxID=1076179 RepID=A0A644XEA3_9ZZZZ